MLTTLRQFFGNLRPRTSEQESLAKEGHREFVGGMWDEMGQLQFDFLVKQGLKPNHVLLDIACGSLRAGRFFISYLEPGNYLGIDKHSELIEAGKAKEVNPDVLKEHRPEFVVSDCFEFEKFSKQPDFCIAQSLFTHLDKQDIELCFDKLGSFVRPGCRFFATFHEASVAIPQVARSHSIRNFAYTRGVAESFGKRAGWQSRYIGDWGHPLGQMMIVYTKR
jgi:ubiquinone/menaquinone biosynthesis C-methylase UbiE